MSHADRVAEILGEWRERRDSGENVTPSDVVAEHPELAGLLRSHFAFVGLLDAQVPREDVASTFPNQIGDFRVLREIGRGAMGVVYEAEQVRLKRRVALKVLSLTFSSSQQALRRFEREARIAASLHHTNLVPIFAMGEYVGHWYYAMDLVHGRPLSQVVAELRRGEAAGPGGPFSTVAESTGARRHAGYVRVADAFAGVAEALHVAHEAGIVHRDVKPSNILLDVSGILKIVDFGLAWQDAAGRHSLTRTGDVLGTPAYMSPEQAQGEHARVDRRSDVYSLGATLYEILTLHPPFEGRNVGDLYSAALTREPLPPRRRVAHVPRDLQTIVLKAMEKEPEKRYATAAELARDLRRFAAGTGVMARPVSFATRTLRWVRRHKARVALGSAAMVVVVLGVVFAVAVSRADRARRAVAYDRLIRQGARSAGLFARPKNSHSARPVEAARALYRDAVALLPDRPEAHWLLGVLGGASTEERLTHLERAHERRLPMRALHLARAHVFSQAQRWDEVRAERKLAEECESEGTADTYLEAMLLQREGHRSRALALFERAINEPGLRAIRTLALEQHARMLLEQGDVPGALDDLSRAIEAEPDAVRLRVKLAAAWRRQGEDDTAEDRFEEALAWARAHDRPDVWAPLAQECWAVREQAWFLRATKDAEARHPGNPRLLSLRAFALGSSGETDACLAIARRLVQADPASHAGYELLGRALTDKGDLEDARAVLERACGLDPRCPRSLQALAWVHLRQGEAKAAVALYDKAVTLAPRFLDAHVQYGDALLATGDAGPALNRYEHVLTLHPSYADAFLGCGQAHEALGATEKAVSAYAQVRALSPSRVDAALHHWRLLEAEGRKADRQSDLERTAAEHLDDPRFLHLRGHALGLLQREAEARDCLASSPERCDACTEDQAPAGAGR